MCHADSIAGIGYAHWLSIGRHGQHLPVASTVALPLKWTISSQYQWRYKLLNSPDLFLTVECIPLRKNSCFVFGHFVDTYARERLVLSAAAAVRAACSPPKAFDCPPKGR